MSADIRNTQAQPEVCSLHVRRLPGRRGWEEKRMITFIYDTFQSIRRCLACCSGDSLICPIHLPLWVIDSQCFMVTGSAGLQTQASFMDERQIYRQKDK